MYRAVVSRPDTYVLGYILAIYHTQYAEWVDYLDCLLGIFHSLRHSAFVALNYFKNGCIRFNEVKILCVDIVHATRGKQKQKQS